MAEVAGGQPASVSYNTHEYDEKWLEALNQWEWQQVGEAHRWRTKGRCPRCQHETELDVSATVILAPNVVPGEGVGGIVVSLPETVEFRCFCEEKHEEGKTGCGLYIPNMRGP